jgi:hypothetical protein
VVRNHWMLIYLDMTRFALFQQYYFTIIIVYAFCFLDDMIIFSKYFTVFSLICLPIPFSWFVFLF